ncbi:tetratricopeptide repeat protein [Microvirga sp. BSC39]|uniref:tetratricopeptide repeat protein n=1 Tax=Microvirga sp. BSC39 TaxID=1549810 RepID=UPI00068DD879|nr:tetratricopeptide repeat protein [Microvirga sp. BSC39]
MKPKTSDLSCRLFASVILLCLLCPQQAMASGTEARRAYVTGKHLHALELAKPTAEQGDPTAMLVLGTLYFRGEGLRQDYAAALKWWLAAAELGNIRAKNNIGVIFREGHGVQRDYNEAIKWFTSAAESGEAYAHWNLGLMHENGQVFPVDVEKALEFYKKSDILFREEAAAEPENYKTISRWIGELTYKIRWLTSLLARPNPVIPMPSTPQSSSGQQATPQ